MKYSKKIIERICDLVSSDDYTINEISQIVSINPWTYYDWMNNKPEFKKAIEDAEQKRFELFKKEARRGLLTLLKGKEYEEVTTEFVEGKPDKDGNTKPKVKTLKKIKKFILPNPTSVIFALKNLDSSNFADTFKQEVNMKTIVVEVQNEDEVD